MTTIKKTIYIEIEVEVEGKYIKEQPGSFYRSNGDPGDPPEPAQFEIQSVKHGNKDITKHLDDINFDWYALEEEILDEIDPYEDNFNED
jgi:hypothetical protein